jgi:hypothetical protein
MQISMKTYAIRGAFAVIGTLLLMTGCKSDSNNVPTTPVAPQSPIVAQVEAAGSGDLETVDTPAMQNWLAKHIDVAKKVAPECATVSKNAPANWAGTTEGRVCTATAHVMFFAPKDLYNGYGSAPKKS